MDNFGFFEIFAGGLALFYAGIKSYGLAIILLTLVVRLLLLPLSIKQTRSMREMAVIQPEIKKLQAKYKGNRQKMNEAMMALYKEHGVNPLGGCLPLLMQFPVLIGLYYVIRFPLKYLADNTALAGDLMSKALEVNRFLGIRLDCNPSHVLSSSASETPSLSDVACGSGFVSFLPYLGLLLAMGFTTYYQQRQMQAQRGVADNPQMQQMQSFMKVMPFIFVVIGYNFPTGLAVYWVTTNLWTIAQQRIILKAAPLPDPKAKGKVAKASKPGAKPGAKGAPAKGSGAKGSGAKGSGAKGSGAKGSGAKGAPAKAAGPKATGGNSRVGDMGSTASTANVGDTGSGSPDGAGRKRKPQPTGSPGRTRPSSKKKRR